MEQQIIYNYFVQIILHKLPICDDVQSIVFSYIDSQKTKKIGKVLSYKLIQLGNVKNPIAFNKKAIQIDKCPALLKSFDTIWDLFSTFLIKDEDKEIIEYWYMITNGKI